jgi:murein DD-endopeptidase MepM/ murein hydrolase activator NlpD
MDEATKATQSQIDLLDKQLKVQEAQVANISAQQEAILTRVFSDSDITAEQARKTIENNAENNAILNESLKITQNNQSIVSNTNDLFEGRNSQLNQELRTIKAQYDQRKRDAILEKANAIARLENEKAAAIAQGGRSEAVAEYQTRINLLKNQLSLQMENNRLTTLQDIAQKALNSSFTFGLEKQQEGLEIVKQQVELSNTLLSQEKDIALTRARIEAKREGGDLTPQAQQAIELNFARRELNVAKQTFELKMAAIDAQYDLLEAQRLATASELQMRVLMLEEAYKLQEGGITSSQQNTINQIKNAAEIFSTRTYDAARELAKAQERNSLTLLELKAEELSIFESGATSFASKVVNATKQAAIVYNSILNRGIEEPTTVSPLEKAVSIVKPDLVNLKNSLDTNVVSLREELTKTISSISALDLSIDGLVEAIRKDITNTPRSSEDIMKTISSSIIKPVQGKVTSGFKSAERAGHDAVDIKANQGTPVVAPISGKVTFGQDPRSGYFAKIVDDTGKIYTSMSHLSKMYIDLAKGTGRVTQGQVIGLSGGTPGTEGAGKSTGAHVHWKLKINGVAVDPMGRSAIETEEIPVKIVDSAEKNISTPTKSEEQKQTAYPLKLALEEMDIVPVVSNLKDLLDTIKLPELINIELYKVGSGFEEVGKKIGAFSAAGKIQLAPFIEELSKLGPEGEVAVAISNGMFTILDNVDSASTKIGEQLKLISSNTLTESEKFQSYAKIAGAALTAVSGMISAVASIAKASADAKVSALDREIAAEQKRDGKSTQSVAKIEAMEKKKDSIARKAFNTNKKLMMANAVVSTAAGVANALGSGLPPPANIILAGLIGAMGMAQLAIIAGTQYESAYTPKAASMPSTLSIGKRDSSVDLARGPNANAGGEAGYLRGVQGTGTNASNYRTIGSAYGGELMRGYGNRGFVVGEKGPEVITPDTPITVTPANESSQAQSINASFNIQALDASGVQDILVSQKGNIIKMLREASNASGKSFMEDVNVDVYTRPSVGKL